MKKNHLLTCKNHRDLISQRTLPHNSFFGWLKLEYTVNLKSMYNPTLTTQKTSCAKDYVEISSPDVFLVKATFALKIPKKKFQFSKFSPNWFSAAQNLLGDSDPTQVGQKNPQTLNLSNRPILSK